MRITSAYANKLLKQLDDEKAYILAIEESDRTYVAERGGEPETDYSYPETREQLRKINEKIIKIKHQINLLNATTEIQVGDQIMTADEILVRLALLNKRKNILDTMRKLRNGARVRQSLIGTGAAPEYRYLAFSQEEVRNDYNQIQKEIISMQMALDRYNQTKEFEVDID